MMTSFTSFLTTTTLLALAFGDIAASVAAASVEETSNNNWEVLDYFFEKKLNLLLGTESTSSSPMIIANIARSKYFSNGVRPLSGSCADVIIT